MSKQLCGKLLGLLLAVAAPLSCVFAEEAPSRPLRVAAEDYPPYEFMKDGRPAGINIDVITHIFGKLGIPCEIKFYPFTRGWLMLTKGTVDAAPSISYQSSREPYLYYTEEQRAFADTGRIPRDYLWITEYVFFINRRFQESLRFESYQQIKDDGYRIGILKEYTYHPGFLDQGFKTRVYVNPIDGIQALANGEIDLFPMDKTVGLSLLNGSELADAIAYLPKAVFTKPYLLTFSKASDYPDLEGVMMRFYDELHAMRASGEYDTILRAYIPRAARAAAGRRLTFVCEDWAPFEYMDGDQLKGIDVDVVDRIMKKLGIPYEIRVYPWSRAWLMAEKGSVDAVLSVSYKASREEALYYTEEQRAFDTTGVLPPDYLWLSEYVFFVKTQHSGTVVFESYEQLARDGYRIGTNRGYSYDPAFLEADLGCVQFNDTREGLQALVAGEIDLYPMDKTVGLATLHDMGLHASVTYLPKPMFRKPYLVPFVRASDYPGLESVMREFNHELRALREGGDYDKIRQVYLHEHGVDD